MSSWNPEANRQDAIETACHNANQALWTEWSKKANSRLALAAALEVIEHERMADHPGLALPFSIQDCIAHLRATASPRRGEP